MYKPSASTVRAFYLSALVMVTGFMSGYDTGVAGGVLTFPSFMNDFRYGQKQETQVNSFTVGFQQIGSVLACLAIYPVTARFGRKLAIQLCAVVFIAGIVVETINTHSLGAWYAGRAVAGVGQGGLCVIAPMYTAEMAPSSMRGQLGSLYQWMFTVGNLLSYWTDYGVAQHIAGRSAEWQIPVALQATAGVVLLFGTFTVPESVRWLIGKQRYDEAWKSLSWVRGSTSDEVRYEFDMMKAKIDMETAQASERPIRDFLSPTNRKALLLGSLTFIFQQGTGSTGLAYFAPQFFRAMVGSGNKDLLLTGVFGAVKLVACTIFILFVADRFGRRWVMSGGAAVMAVCMLTTGLIVKYHPSPKVVSDSVPASGIATVVLLYINIMAFNFSWGPIAWVYVGELFSHNNRELGIAISVAIQWLFSFTFSISTSYMLAAMGWGIFVFYAVFDCVTAVCCFFMFKETRNVELENVVEVHEIDAVELKASREPFRSTTKNNAEAAES